MQTEIHTAEPFVPEPRSAEVEVAIRKMKRYKAPGSEQIPAELIQAGGKRCFLRYINLLCSSGTKRIASPMKRVNCCTYSQKG
jgi:hypothetical protein